MTTDDSSPTPTVDPAIELAVRRILAEETTKFREFLERSIRLFAFFFFSLLTIGAAIAVFLFGQTFGDIEKKLAGQVDRQVIAYRINDSLKRSLQEEVRALLASQEVTSAIGDQTRKRVEEEVTQRVEGVVAKAVTDAVSNAQKIDLDDAIRTAIGRTLRERDADIQSAIRRLERIERIEEERRAAAAAKAAVPVYEPEPVRALSPPAPGKPGAPGLLP